MKVLQVNRAVYVPIIILSFLVAVSCKQSTFDTEKALWTYLKDENNGYLQTKRVQGVDFSILYKPTDLLVQQELKGEAPSSKIDSLREKYGKHLYFSLSMSRNNQELLNSAAGNRHEFGKMVHTLAFGMENKIHLYTEKKDTIAMVDYNYPRMYGMSRKTSILLVYPKEAVKDAKEVNLTIEDLGFGTGEVRFIQTMDKINHQPQLY